MNNENKSIPFTTDQLRSSLRTGSILADLHASCSAMEQLSAQILTTSAPENLPDKQNAIIETTATLRRLVIDLVDTCINLDKTLVSNINKEIE